MKSWLICLVLISMMVTAQEVAAEVEYHQLLKLCDEVKPSLFCHLVKGKRFLHVPINSYNRACSPDHPCPGA